MTDDIPNSMAECDTCDEIFCLRTCMTWEFCTCCTPACVVRIQCNPCAARAAWFDQIVENGGGGGHEREQAENESAPDTETHDPEA